MKKVRRREILVETEQILLFINKSKKNYLRCIKCGGNALMLPPALIAEVLDFSSRIIYRQIESGRIHFVESDTYQMFVCINSIANVFAEKKKLINYKTGGIKTYGRER